MEAEHCSMDGSKERFWTGSTKRETWPANEWSITVRGDYTHANVGPSRKLHTIAELIERPVVKQAKLTRPEVIAVVLYTGPMVIVFSEFFHMH